MGSVRKDCTQQGLANRVQLDEDVSIAIVVLTHDRASLLEQCVKNVVSRTSLATTELLFWDNGSRDDTSDVLSAVRDSRVRVVRTPENVGMVAYGRAIAMTTAPFIIQLDDDVIEAPTGWDALLLRAFRELPRVAWLAADLEDEHDDRASYDRHHVHQYRERVVNGISLLDGPAGGWCTITSRAIYDEVGGLPTTSKHLYFSTDTIYVKKIRRAGYETAILPSVRVRHRGDHPDATPAPAKAAFHAREAASQARKNHMKRALLLVPGMRAANRRRRWFTEPPT